MEIPIHPFLLALFPLLSLWANNLEEISPSDPVRSVIASLLAVLVLVLPIAAVTREPLKVSLIVSMLVVVWSSYGHLYDGLKDFMPGFASLIRHRYLISVGGILILGAAVWLWRGLHRPGLLTKVANVITAGLLILPLLAIGRFYLEAQLASSMFELPARSVPASESVGRQPDIYYIVLDGYGREDLLRGLYQYDNSPFLDELRERGFYVADEATSNYMQTRLSVASSMNMDYLDELTKVLPQERVTIYLLPHLIEQSRIYEHLAEHGYHQVAFPSRYGPTDITSAEIYVDFNEVASPMSIQDVVLTGWTLNRFETMVVMTTFVRALIDLQALGVDWVNDQAIDRQYQNHREAVLHSLTEMDQVARWTGDYFVFVHVVAPHPPFVFGPSGEPITAKGPLTFLDGSDFKGSRDEYIENYRDQLQFINSLLLTEIDEILVGSDQEPIIILQSDHGPGAYLDWESLENTLLRERFSILNAYYLPGHELDLLYPSISPVNSFRIILNRYFGEDYEILEDRNYFSYWDEPSDYIDVTEDLGTQ